MKTLRFIFLFILLFVFNIINGQITIDGTIIDSESNPISDALVEVIDQNDTSNYYSSVTNESGYFAISNITEISSRKFNLPSDYIVVRNYPNPFNPSTIIYYELPKSENIEIKIYDILGREVRTLYNNFHKAGIYTLEWNGRNSWNSPVAAGIYFCRLKTKDQFKVHKMVLLDGGSTSALTGNIKIKKSHFQNISKISSRFEFSIRIIANSILESDFKYLSCSGDTTVNLIVPRIIKTAIIGPEGGKLETEDFSLTIPDGAFSVYNEIKLGKGEKNKEFPNYELTEIYLLQGIPASFNGSIKLKIKYHGELSDSIYIAVGKSDYDVPENNQETFYDLLSAEDSSGYLISEYISPFKKYLSHRDRKISKTNTNEGWGVLRILGLRGQKIAPINSPHFKIFYPDNLSIEKAKKVGEYLEEAFEKFKEMDFNYSHCAQWSIGKKVNIIIKSSSLENFGYFASDENQDQALIINGVIDKDHLIDLSNEMVRRKAGALFFELLTYLYDFDRYNIPGRQWIHIASEIWAETIFPENSDYIPAKIFGNEMAPFYGIEYRNSTGSPFQINKKGAGMSSLIKYITRFSDNGNKVIEKIYQELGEKDYPIEAIKSSLNNPVTFWLPDYFKKYISGEIFMIPHERFIKNVVKTVALNEGDTLKQIENDYSDLSSKMYLININSEEIKNKTLNFCVKSETVAVDYLKIIVFGISNNNLIFLSQGNDFNVAYFQSYDELLVCVVNSMNEAPYTGISNIDLDIRVTNDLAFKYCDIRLAVIEMHDTLEGVWSPGWYTKGTFNDNVFDGVINTKKQGGNSTGTIRVVVDDNQNILSLDVMAYHNDPIGFSSQWGFTAKNIPPTENEPYLLVYSYLGYDVCNYVKSIYAKYTEVDGSEWEIKNSKCDQESNLHIKFHNWD